MVLVACGVWVGLDVSPGSVVGRAAGTSSVQGEVQLCMLRAVVAVGAALR